LQADEEERHDSDEDQQRDRLQQSPNNVSTHNTPLLNNQMRQIGRRKNKSFDFLFAGK
jgi:hypothetical protein